MPERPNWELRDFVDERGRNRIQAWLDSYDPGVVATVNARLLHFTRLSELKRPNWSYFKKPWNKIGEIRIKTQDFTIRILSCRGPDEGVVTMLFGTHKKTGDVTPGEKDEAVRRMGVMKHDPEARTEDHDFEG